MSEKIVQLNEEVIKGQLKELVRGSVEETLNELLEQEAEKLTQAARYERNEARQGYRSGHYDRNLTTTSGDVTLHVPRLKGVSFETAVIERYRRRESSVEEALIEMYLAGVSVRRVEDITEALWGSKVSPATISELNKKAYVHIEDWRNRPLQGGRYPYVYVDGIYLRRNWGGEYENAAILVAIAVNEDGYREVLGAAEGMREDKASWVSFFQWLKGRGLDGVKLIVGDKCLGMLEAVNEVFPTAKYQRCTVHFYRNVFSVVPRSKVKLVAKMLKAIHGQENKKAAREKAKAVVAQLKEMKLKEAARKVEDNIEETLTYLLSMVAIASGASLLISWPAPGTICKVAWGSNSFNFFDAFRLALSFSPHTIATGQVIPFNCEVKSNDRIEWDSLIVSLFDSPMLLKFLPGIQRNKIF